MIGYVLAALGTLVVVATSVGALLPRGSRGRLHFLTPITSMGAPLIGIGVAVDSGVHLSTAMVLAVVAALAGTGPALAAATGRVSAQRDGRIPAETPE